MEFDDDSRSNSSSSSSSSSADSRPSSPQQEENNGVNTRSRSASRSPSPSQQLRSRSNSPENNSSHYNDDDSNSVDQGGSKNESRNHSVSPPVREAHGNHTSDEDEKQEEEELELSDVEPENGRDDQEDGELDNVNSKDNLNISHEDLSDVSDLDSVPQSPAVDKSEDKEKPKDASKITDLRQKIEERKLMQKEQKQNGSDLLNDSLEKKNDEDILDFEAEEGECRDVEKPVKAEESNGKKREEGEEDSENSENELEEGEELEDGEVTDGDDKRPEENEPKPVCRFYTRGQCTWGVSCRFLHPGVTDKGNYSMFDIVRPVPIPQAPMVPPFGGPLYQDYRTERPPIHHLPPPHHAPYGHPPAAIHPRGAPPAEAESSWERGLLKAKEMMKKANKRKEQDIDFEDKKMNLSLSQDEMEKDNYYIRDRASPDISPPYAAGGRSGPPPYDYTPPGKFQRMNYEDGRVPRYRELPAHRMPHYEDDDIRKRRTSAREVIVQKADEWSDPWMRSKSPGGRGGSVGRRRDRRGGSRRDRSYSSDSSYSSSRSSSSSTSDSDVQSRNRHRKRYDSHRDRDHDRISNQRKPIRTRSRSSSMKRRYSPPVRSPYKRPEKKISPSPTMDRRAVMDRNLGSKQRKKGATPPPSQRKPTHHSNLNRKKHQSSSSDSGSSDSSESESGSSYSSGSTSGSKGPSRGRTASKKEKAPVLKKVEMSKKRISPPKDDDKEKPTNIPSANDKNVSKQKSTRREELLKQLRAVEDAIARKRSKIT